MSLFWCVNCKEGVTVPHQAVSTSERERVAAEILRYLERLPSASDTIDGIASWWIPRQRLHEARAVVEAAVELLVEQRRLQVTKVAGGENIYRAAEKRRPL